LGRRCKEVGGYCESAEREESSFASAHRLRSGLVRKAPRESLSSEDWMVFRRFMVDLHDWLYIGDP